MQVHASQVTDTILSGVYHLTGEDGFWLEQTLTKFMSIVGKDSLSLHIFDKGDSFADAIGSLYSVSFAGDVTVVIVKEDLILGDGKNQKLLADVLRGNIAPNYLVLVNQTLSAQQKKLVNTINCTKLKEYECAKFAEKFFANGISFSALKNLVRYTDCDLLKIKLESQKLLAYANGRKVTEDDVDELVAEDGDLQIFNFVNSIVTGDSAKALKQLARLKKRGESRSGMLAMLLNQFRRMLHTNISKKTDEELSSIFKVHKFAIVKARENSMFGAVKLKNTVDMIVDYELKFKSGKMSEQAAFDSCVARLIAKEVN